MAADHLMSPGMNEVIVAGCYRRNICDKERLFFLHFGGYNDVGCLDMF